MLGLSSAHKYCPNVLLGGAVPVLAAVSDSEASFLAFEGLLGMPGVVSLLLLPNPTLRLLLPAHLSHNDLY